MSKITVLIPCGNERDMIRECVESVRWADEIFVVESFSTDGTLDIIKELGVRYVQHKYENYGSQNNWALPQCSHEWILTLDADERVTPELAEEIRAIVAANGPYNGYSIRRQNFFLGRPIRYSGWGNDWHVRLFRRDVGRYQTRNVHAGVVVPGTPGYCKNVILHYSCRNLADYLKKTIRYAQLGAQVKQSRGVKPRLYRLITVPVLRFLRNYIVKAGFLEGWRGLVISGIYGMEGFLREAFLWQLHEVQRETR